MGGGGGLIRGYWVETMNDQLRETEREKERERQRERRRERDRQSKVGREIT